MEPAGFDVIFGGLDLLLQPNHLMWLFLGMVAGLIVGAIPWYRNPPA